MPRMKITFERTGILAIPRSKLRDAFREGIYAAGVRWWSQYLPIHFTEQGRARYHFKSREPGYDELKREGGEVEGVRAIGDSSPNVFSGHTREVAKNKNVTAIASNADQVRVEVVINSPALNFQANKRIDVRSELTTLLKYELDDLQSVYANESQSALERMGRTERIIKRISA